MAQLHCYVSDEIAVKFRKKAEHVHISVSKYLAKLIKKEINAGWPENYTNIFGSWEGEVLKRPDQGIIDERTKLK